MSAADLVGEIDGLRARTRRASFGGAVPLAILGAVVAGSAPFQAGVAAALHPEPGPDGTVAVTVVRRGGGIAGILWSQRTTPAHARLLTYWLVAIPVAFLLIAVYAAWRARRTGISLRGWRVAAVGAAVGVALIGTIGLSGSALVPDSGLRVSALLNPLLVVVAGVFGIAWVERSRTVLAVAVLFLLAVFAADVRSYAGGGLAAVMHVGARTYREIGPQGAYGRVGAVGSASLLLGGWLLAWAAALGAAYRRRTP